MEGFFLFFLERMGGERMLRSVWVVDVPLEDEVGTDTRVRAEIRGDHMCMWRCGCGWTLGTSRIGARFPFFTFSILCLSFFPL